MSELEWEREEERREKESARADRMQNISSSVLQVINPLYYRRAFEEMSDAFPELS